MDSQNDGWMDLDTYVHTYTRYWEYCLNRNGSQGIVKPEEHNAQCAVTECQETTNNRSQMSSLDVS